MELAMKQRTKAKREVRKPQARALSLALQSLLELAHGKQEFRAEVLLEKSLPEPSPESSGKSLVRCRISTLARLALISAPLCAPATTGDLRTGGRGVVFASASALCKAESRRGSAARQVSYTSRGTSPTAASKACPLPTHPTMRLAPSPAAGHRDDDRDEEHDSPRGDGRPEAS